MRMKKLLIIAAAALLAAACAKTYEVKETTPPAIGFGTWAEQLTKAEARVQGSSTFLAGDTFAIYGSKTSDATTTVFSGDVVTASGTGTLTWDYATHRNWDSSADSYSFYAVSPSGVKDVTGASINPQNGAITTGSTVFSGNNNDILIANQVVVAKGSGASSTYFNSYAAVNMEFHHAASLVDIHVKKASTVTADVKISSISLDNIYTTGVLTVASTDYSVPVSSAGANPTITAPNILVGSWAATVSGSYLPAAGVSPVYGDTDTSAPIAADNQKIVLADDAFDPDNTTAGTTPASGKFTTLFNNLVLVPQTFGPSGTTTSQKITIVYTIGTDPTSYTRTLYLADFDKVDNSNQTNDAKAASAFEPGKHYSFYITIDSHEISFTAQINDWTDITGYHYLIN